jgi:SH3-like domain-containing protein
MPKYSSSLFLLVFFLVISSLPGSLAALAETEPVVISEEGARLRSTPTTTAEVVETLKQGAVVTLLQEGVDDQGLIWFRLRTASGEEGWTASWLLQFGETKWVVVSEDQLNLREGPGRDRPAITQLSADTMLIVLGQQADEEEQLWYQVRTPESQEGWVASWLVRPGRVSAAPVPPPPPPVSVVVQAPDGPITLTDIYYHWAKDTIVAQVQDGLAKGYPDGTFRPDQPLSRAEFYALLVRMRGVSTQSPPTSSFADLSTEHWAYPYIETAVRQGYMGTSLPAQLQPDAPISRQEIVLAAVRALGMENLALQRIDAFAPFTDTIPQALASYVQVAFDSKLVNGYPDGSFRLAGQATRAESMSVLERMKKPAKPGTIYLCQKTITLSSDRTTTVEFARVDLKNANIRARVYISHNQVGRLDSMQNLGDENGLSVALPAAYFDKKSSDPLNPDGPFRYIWGNLENDGTFITLSNEGTSIGFTGSNTVYFAPLEVGITGRIIPQQADSRTSSDLNFYVSGLNQPLLPDSVRLYSPAYGEKVNVGDAKAVVLRQYKVQGIFTGTVSIPRDGFVLASPAGTWLYTHFQVGDRVELKYKYSHNVTGQLLPWVDVHTTISAGPRLLKEGNVALNHNEEKFDDSLLASTARRTAIGMTNDRVVVLLNAMDPLTLAELAQVMADLGCSEAVNLDGGASTSLYYKGIVVNQPRGSLTNVLGFIED